MKQPHPSGAPISTGAPEIASELDITLPPSFPAGRYTPHGYLDNPYHSLVHNRSGLLRSVPPLGMGWWRRTFRGTYGHGARADVNYLSLLQMGVALGELRLVTAEDFTAHGIELVARYHTGRVLSYDFRHGDLDLSFRYFLAGEHALACLVDLRNRSNAPEVATVHATHIYGLWEQPWWGSDGLAMHYVREVDAAVSAIWAYGDYFALGATLPGIAHKATGSHEERNRWLAANDLSTRDAATLRGPGPLHTVMSYRLAVPPNGRAGGLICLARGPHEAAALDELRAGLRDAAAALERQLDADEGFWSACPQLEGDWPLHWQHGWVYDWETLRMNVRPPVGIFKRPWDAMQVHSPRLVLAEAALDAFALSHADPELAQAVLLGAFADAPAPNVPCCREDGSMNMIAPDGEACGTAPSWCFPFHIIRAIYAATHDEDWLTALYPHLKTYLEWWLAHRTDEHGRLHCKCDWESGQDGSQRFVRSGTDAAASIHAVDVEAAVAEALACMAAFARVVDPPAEARWAELAAARARTTQAMFVDGWFRDHDTRTGQPILGEELDIMMLAPLACGVATPEQAAVLRSKLEHFRKNPRPWLEWPSFFLVYAEAAWAAGRPEVAAEATADIADRVYARTDARRPLFADATQPFTYRVPGVACEYWPVPDDVEPGGENYGWGATLPLHVIRSIVGLREMSHVSTSNPAAAPHVELVLAPCLPHRLREPGRSYGMRNLRFRELALAVRYVVRPDGGLNVAVQYAAPDERMLSVRTRDGTAVLEQREEQQGVAEFTAHSGEVFTLRFERREL